MRHDFQKMIEASETLAGQYVMARAAMSQEDLDEAVTDALCAEATSLSDESSNLDADIDAAETAASEINNGGQVRQVAALMALGWKAAEIDEKVGDADPANDCDI